MSHLHPQFLPDGRHLLFFVQGSGQGTYIASLDSTETRWLIASDTAAAYSPIAYLRYMRQGTLFAQHFDPKAGAVSGDPIPVADSIAFHSCFLKGGFSVAETGMLAYRTSAKLRRLVWLDRSGKEVGMLGVPDENYLQGPQLSPDGRHVAVERSVQGNMDVWLLETARGVPRRFTFDAAIDFYPIWSPDGSRVFFSSGRKGPRNLYQKAFNGADVEESLRDSSFTEVPFDCSPDGRFLLFLQVNPKTAADLWVLPPFGERFLINITADESSTSPITIVTNWVRALKK